MKKCPKYYCIILSFILLFNATAQTQIQKLYLHPKSNGTEKQTKFVDSLRFIPLEVKDGINLGSYTNIEVTDKYFLLIDYSSKSFLLYSKNGQFIRKVNYKNLGGNFYPAYHEATNQIVFFGGNKNYSLTPKDVVKVRLDWTNPRNRKYFKKYLINLNDTTFKMQPAVPQKNDIIAAYPFYNDYYWQGEISTSPLYNGITDHELKIYRNDKLVKSYFPYDRSNEPRFLFTEESTMVTKTSNAFVHYVSRPYCDTIYKMINDSLFPAYHMVMPLENSLPPTFSTKPFKTKTDRDNFGRNNGWMFRQIYNFYETPQLIFFAVRYFSNYESYIYQKRNNLTLKTKNIKADSTHFNLQVLADLGLLRKGDKFYKPQKAGELLTYFQQNKDVPVPKELEDFIKQKPHSTTPVIIEFKLKNTL